MRERQADGGIYVWTHPTNGLATNAQNFEIKKPRRDFSGRGIEVINLIMQP
jgi:hypothetical protein